MNREEIDSCLDLMTSLWEKSVPDDLVLHRWKSHLTTIAFDVAAEIIDRLEKECNFFPTWHQFHAHLFPVQNNPAFKPATFNPNTPEEKANVNRLIADIRAGLAEGSRRQHWHGGPKPCPVCGGFNPDIGGRHVG